MPANACVAFYDCKGCGKTLRPLAGSCCVFCSYGSVPCPPVQQGVEPCCTPLSDQRSKDWLGNTRASLMAWWVPTALVVAGLLASVPLRAGIWVAALAWMGLACLLNASRSGRTPLSVHGAILPADDSAHVGARDGGCSALRLAGVGSVSSLG
jgi:hypothetical protein